MLLDEADVAVELYGGALARRLDGSRRVYIRRFEYVSFVSGAEALHAYLRLWREVECLRSVAVVERAAGSGNRNSRASDGVIKGWQ